MNSENLLGNGIYTISESSRYLGISESRLRNWVFGKESSGKKGSVISADYKPVNNSYALSFYDLIDAYVMKMLLDKNQSIHKIRKAYNQLSNDLKINHPFCHITLKVQGPNIIAQAAKKAGSIDLYHAITRQGYFPQFKAGLDKLEYDEISNFVRKLKIYKGINLDPEISFGKPVIDKTSTTTYILAKSYLANDRNLKLVAELFDVKPSDVTKAFKFETELGHMSKAA